MATPHGQGLPHQLGRLLRESGPLTRWQIREVTGWSRYRADYAIERGQAMGVVRKEMVALSLEQIKDRDFYRTHGYVFLPGVRLDKPCECPACSGWWRAPL